MERGVGERTVVPFNFSEDVAAAAPGAFGGEREGLWPARARQERQSRKYSMWRYIFRGTRGERGRE